MVELHHLDHLVFDVTEKEAELCARFSDPSEDNTEESMHRGLCMSTGVTSALGLERNRLMIVSCTLFVSYSSKESGRGLLVVQSDSSRLRGRLYRPVNDSNLQETLCGFWKEGGAAGRRIIMDTRRHADLFGASKTEKAAELQEAEAVHGALNRLAEDMCCVAGRILRPFINTRELAYTAVKYGTRNEYPMNKGFFARRVHA